MLPFRMAIQPLTFESRHTTARVSLPRGGLPAPKDDRHDHARGDPQWLRLEHLDQARAAVAGTSPREHPEDPELCFHRRFYCGCDARWGSGHGLYAGGQAPRKKKDAQCAGWVY